MSCFRWMIVSAGVALGAMIFSPIAAGQTSDDVAVFRIVGQEASPQQPPASSDQERDLLRQAEELQRLRTEKLRADVEAVLRAASRLMATEPDTSIDELKRTLLVVQDATDVEAEARATLIRRLQTALLEANRRKQELELRRVEAEQRRAAAEERRRATEQLRRDHERLQQLLDHFASLMKEERYEEAEALVRQVEEDYLAEAVPKQAVEFSEVTGNLALITSLRLLRQDKFIQTLTQAELAHVPFPDEPPILFPPPEVWRALSERRIARYSSVDLAPESEQELRIRRELDSPTSFQFPAGIPLGDVVQFIRESHGIPVYLDERPLVDLGVDSNTPVGPLNLQGIKLKSALKLLLDPLDATYLIRDEVLFITAYDPDENLVMKVYPVGDLVIPITSGGGGGLGGLGGIGGGLGGGGGGFGGGGGGLGGGGGGGGGFGGGGGGMLNIPSLMPRPSEASPDLIHRLQSLIAPQSEDANGGAGSDAKSAPGSTKMIPQSEDAHAQVPDVLRGLRAQVDTAAARRGDGNQKAKVAFTEAENSDEEPSGDKPPGGEADRPFEPRAGQLRGPAGPDTQSSPEQIWDEHFASHQESPRAVRDAVRVLIAAAHRDRSPEARQQKFRHVSALIQAALRHGQGQLWMYEALMLTLRAQRVPPEQIDQVLVAAAALTHDDPETLMHVGTLLARDGRYQAALHLFQESARLAPTLSEPYVIGMHIAVRQDDPEGLQWAASAILTHLPDRPRLCDQARRIAESAIERLRKAGRDEEADRLAKAVAEAQVYDLKITLSWSGEADLDLVVEEPGGTVCSFREPRTSGGGWHLGDAFGNTHTETYLCREGFAGSYRARVRLIWGQPAAKRAKLEVIRHAGTPQEQRQTQTVLVGESDAVATVQIEDGRRTELAEVPPPPDPNRDPLSEQRAVLDRLRKGGLNASRLASSSAAPFVIGVRPVVGPGAVAFQPVIVPLPSGAIVSATGVASADRRYVRLNVAPFFSQVGEVTTFTTNLGAVSGGGLVSGTLFGGLGF